MISLKETDLWKGTLQDIKSMMNGTDTQSHWIHMAYGIQAYLSHLKDARKLAHKAEAGCSDSWTQDVFNSLIGTNDEIISEIEDELNKVLEELYSLIGDEV